MLSRRRQIQLTKIASGASGAKINQYKFLTRVFSELYS